MNPYHVPVIRHALTRNTSAWFPDLRDELVVAFDDVLSLEKNGDPFLLSWWLVSDILSDWKTFRDTRKLALQIICRASNRVFVGLPLCRFYAWRV